MPMVGPGPLELTESPTSWSAESFCRPALERRHTRKWLQRKCSRAPEPFYGARTLGSLLAHETSRAPSLERCKALELYRRDRLL